MGKEINCIYMMIQQPPDCCGAYGSSRLSTLKRLYPSACGSLTLHFPAELEMSHT
jgi:hypothetical protein